MEEKQTKQEKKRRFFKNVKGRKRFFLFAGIYLSVFLVFFIVSAELTSRASFCPTCHYMEPFHKSWRTSAHNQTECVECHMEPGVAGLIKGKVNGLVMVVNYTTGSYSNRRPWAEIPDNTCSRSGCHEMQATGDTIYKFKEISFSHKNHLGELRRGKKLKCTSCHSQIVQGTHIQVTTSTCFNCHFKRTDDVSLIGSKVFECITCHKVQQLSGINAADKRYDHLFISSKQVACVKCHGSVTTGEGSAEKDRCLQCHFELDKIGKFEQVDTVHTIHINGHNVPCYYCHTNIKHIIQTASPLIARKCEKCHTEPHFPHFSLFAGRDGNNTETIPSAMYLKGIDCDGCHMSHFTDEKGMGFEAAGSSTCESCHEKGFDDLMRQWKEATQAHLAEINFIYAIASRIVNTTQKNRKEEAEVFLKQAEKNIKIVTNGLSVHNILYTDRLFRASYELMQKALASTGSSQKLPEYLSSSDFVPNECYSCHSGVEEISKKVFDMNFSHNLHLIRGKVSCTKCHSNARKHGELTVSRQNCNSCHHARVNIDDDCVSCHQLQVKIFNGTYLDKNQPDYMKQGGVKCIDCHADNMKIMKPALDVCSKCHDNTYKQMALEWESEFRNSLKETAALFNNIPENQLNEQQKSDLKEVKNLINDLKLFRSIFVHNHELISSLLSEKLKFLKQFQYAAIR